MLDETRGKGLRIAYLSAARIPSMTAYGIHVMKMAQAFSRQGHAVGVFALAGGAGSTSDVFAFYDAPQSFDLYLRRESPIPKWRVARLGMSIASELKKAGDYDIIYSRNALLLLACVGLGLPAIYESHAPPQTWVARRLEGLLLRQENFSHLVVISHALAGLYESVLPGLDRSRIIVAPDAADQPCMELTGMKLRGNVAALHVGYVGSLYRGRGVDMIVQIAQDNLDMEFHILGGTPDEVAAIRSRHDSANIHWHGHIRQKDLASYYALFDVAVAPYESAVAVAGNKGNTVAWMSPLKVFEYMAHRKAIVASDLPVLREVLENERNALLVLPEDISCWNHALRQLAGDPAKRAEIAAAGHAQFLRWFTWDTRARSVLAPVTPAYPVTA